MEISAPWQAIMDGTSSNGDVDGLILGSARQLDNALKERPGIPHDVLDLLTKRLQGVADSNAWPTVTTSLANYLGGESAGLVCWVVSDDQTNRMQKLESSASPAIVAFMRSVLGYFGSDLENAYTLWYVLRDDWRRVDREVLFDSVTGKSMIRVRFFKYSGDVVALECPPTSFASLVGFMIETLRKLGTPAALNAQQIDDLVKETEALAQFLKPSPATPSPIRAGSGGEKPQAKTGGRPAEGP